MTKKENVHVLSFDPPKEKILARPYSYVSFSSTFSKSIFLVVSRNN